MENTQGIWDREAETFDQEPDHGLRDPGIREAWKSRLVSWLPPAPSTVLDIGCGTGSLSVLMTELGHTVVGVDFSPAMLAQARAKAAGYQINYQVMDATNPALAPQRFDAIVCRHLLWTLPEPAQVLQRWVTLLKPDGRLILVEGYWYTNAGLHAAEVLAALPSVLGAPTVEDLSNDSRLWGRKVADERYLVRAALPG